MKNEFRLLLASASKIAHDFHAQLLRRVYRKVRATAARLRDKAKNSGLVLILNSMTDVSKPKLSDYRKARAKAKSLPANDSASAQVWRDLGDALFALRRYKEAIAYYNKVLVVAPDARSVWERRSAAMRAIGKKEALKFKVEPHDADSWTVRAGKLWFLGRFTEAVEASDRALSFDPQCGKAKRLGIRSRLHSCDWSRREQDKQEVSNGLRAGSLLMRGIDHLAQSDSLGELRLGAQIVARHIPRPAEPLWRGERYRHDKIRIAYISSDLRAHAMAYLITGVFEHHDKTRFETTAISLHPDDGGDMRRRVKAAFDRFVDAQAMSDVEVAAMLHALEIDIAVDLNGYTASARTGIFAHRPAPVQVSYLGYPATMALPFIDYLIADRVVIPHEDQRHFSEKVVYLPRCYLPNDSKRVIPAATPSRSDAGLPEAGFVFGCFNNNFKLGPEMFDIWMRLLGDVEGSVLWLLEDNASARRNLRREAELRGIAPERLIFAPRRPVGEHLARQRLADLFLDTLPYGAHTTASDALWVGLPVLTCAGNSFAGRVAASALLALGLPELVTSSLREYEDAARALALNPERLASIKTRLLRNRDTEPFFDTARSTRDLETAYTMMWERTQVGESPIGFSVPSAGHLGALRDQQPI